MLWWVSILLVLVLGLSIQVIRLRFKLQTSSEKKRKLQDEISSSKELGNDEETEVIARESGRVEVHDEIRYKDKESINIKELDPGKEKLVKGKIPEAKLPIHERKLRDLKFSEAPEEE